MAMLTVAVPTYNRPKQLRDTVARLLPQLDDDCELRIYDNLSTPPTAEVIADLLKQHPKAKVTVIRNQVNIGMLGNVIRCMEDCPSQWLVMCGDDDPPRADFVAKVKRAVATYPESIFISFGFVAENRTSEFVTTGMGGFARGNYIFGDILSISAGAYRMEPLRPFMSLAYMYAYTIGPHIAVVLAALRANGGQCAFVPDQLADAGKDYSVESWARIWYPSHVLLLELIPDAKDRAAFGKKLLPYMVNQSYLTDMLIANSLATHADNIFLFDSRMKFRSMLVSSSVISVRRMVFRYLIRNPRLGSRIMKWLKGGKHRPGGFDSSEENFFGQI